MIAESVIPESIITKSVVQVRIARKSGAPAAIEAAAHAAGEVTSAETTMTREAGVTAAEAGVTGKTPAVATTESTMTTTTAVTASTLRPQGHCEKKGERHDGHQAAHTALL